MGWLWRLCDRPKRPETPTDVRQRHVPECRNPQERSILCACLPRCIKLSMWGWEGNVAHDCISCYSAQFVF